MSYTKGPWDADRGFTDMLGSSGHWTLDDNFMTVFCGEEAIEDFDPEKHDYIEIYGPNQDANAALVKVAPDLLEALEAALDWIDAVPHDTALPAMPGVDRDWVEGIIAEAKGVPV